MKIKTNKKRKIQLSEQQIRNNTQKLAIAIKHTDKQATPQMTKINNTEHAWMKQKHV